MGFLTFCSKVNAKSIVEKLGWEEIWKTLPVIELNGKFGGNALLWAIVFGAWISVFAFPIRLGKNKQKAFVENKEVLYS